MIPKRMLVFGKDLASSITKSGMPIRRKGMFL
jgi:hypothetical protein